MTDLQFGLVIIEVHAVSFAIANAVKQSGKSTHYFRIASCLARMMSVPFVYLKNRERRKAIRIRPSGRVKQSSISADQWIASSCAFAKMTTFSGF
jgi:hypothetical protein